MKFLQYLEEYYPNLRLVEGSYSTSKHPAKVQCISCNTEWSITPGNFKNRGDKSKCPKCSPKVAHNRKDVNMFREQLLLKFPELLLLSEYKTAREKVTVGCAYGHTWLADPSHLLNTGVSAKCRECEGLPAWGTKPAIFFNTEISNKFPTLEVMGMYKSAKSAVTVKNKICGHTWEIIPNALLVQGIGSICRVCTPNHSKPEKELLDFIKDNYSGWILENDRSILDGKELDIVLPDLGLAFEFNGIYWHNEDRVDKFNHYNKTDNTNVFGYQLIHIYEDIWINNKNLIKAKILSLLGKNTKIYARKCVLKEISFPKEFLNSNHLQGAGSPTKYNYGLFYNEELVSVMTFSTPRFSSAQDYELVRYCSKAGITIVGGASKLFKAFNKGSIVSYSNRSWSNGGIYNILGFTYSHTSAPNYRYYKGLNSLSRYECQKHLLKTKFPNSYKDTLTESEIMKLEGYIRVYDSGNDVWIKQSRSTRHT